MDQLLLQALLLTDSTIRLATPLVLAALAGLFAERSGVVDIGLEGKMLGAAFAAAATAAVTGSAWLGLAAGTLFSIFLALVHGFACITNRGNQVVSGMALNIMVAGLGPTLAEAWFRQGGRTPLLGAEARFTPITLPLADAVRDVPVLGPIYAELISGHNILVYATAAVVPVVAWVVYRTRFGLRLRAVGENPSAVDTAGISVAAMRYKALLVTGLLCGVAGTYLSIAHNAAFLRDMTAGKGYLALAALIFGKWRPVPALFACFLFAFTDAVQIRLQGVPLPGIGTVPTQAIQALPYLATVLLLAGFVGRAIAPKAIGQPYVKER
jgi:simple sugar transport system permease protein